MIYKSLEKTKDSSKRKSNEHQQSYHVDTLVEMMGCTQERARAVLAAHDYSLERAVDVLLSEE